MFDWLRKRTPAQNAGRAAGMAWQKMSDHLDEDIETLTGKEVLVHAKEEARRWLCSVYDRYGEWAIMQVSPEQKRHEEFLQYIEAFISALPPASRGYPKE